MSFMILVLFGVTILYIAVLVWLRFGMRRERCRPRRLRLFSPGTEPLVSVVVAARNEEANLRQCLESILGNDYPKEKLEVVVVDDRSTDATPSIIADLTREHPNLRSLRIERDDGKLRGKTNALARGIPTARGEIIMLTDADCIVSRTWVRETAKYFTEDVGIVAGVTMLNDTSWFSGMQALDWMYLLSVAASTIGLRIPLTVIGNNLSFRKAAYEQVGGYEAVPFSVTEDQALFRAIITKTSWDHRFPIDGGCGVTSDACSTFGELRRQKHRWGIGGKDIQFRGPLIMSVGVLEHLLLVLSPLYAPAVWPAFAALAVKCGGDAMFASRALREYGRVRLLRDLPLFELYFIIYTIVLPIAIIVDTKVVWKGRTYR